MESRADIFLSYSRDDQATARRFADALQAQGFSVWWDQTLHTGEAYDHVTEQALRSARAVVVLWSKTSVVSRWVRAEATIADRQKTLMPAMIEPCDRPVMFELTQTAELSHWKGDAKDAAWQAFVADLRRVTAREPAAAVEAPPPPSAPVAHKARGGGRGRWLGVGAVAVLVIAAAGWFWQRSAGAHRARTELIPEVSRLVDAGDNEKAFELAREARRYVPDDPLLATLTPLFTVRYSVASTPDGADVYVRSYGAAEAKWQHLGRTPIKQVELPRISLRWRVEKEGFVAAERANSAGVAEDAASANLSSRQIAVVNVELRQADQQPEGMVLVPGGPAVQLDSAVRALADLQPYYLGRDEVTNAEFKAFVDAGGYERRSLWEGLDLRKDGKPLTVEAALRLFVDSTGRPGPSTWELGTYPEGRGNYPVTGVSWYEAMAYARYKGQALPTYYHWLRAAQPANEISAAMAASIAPLSNFGTDGPAEVGKYQGVGLFGTHDLFGNAREWLRNPGARGGWLMGGSWEDPTYAYLNPVEVPLLDRSHLNGMRLVKAASEVPEQASLGDVLDLRVNRTVAASLKPVSEEVYADYRRQLAYEPGKLNATEPETLATTEDWTKQRVTIDTGYNNERMDLILFIPRRASKPYQPVVFFSGGQIVLFPGKTTDIDLGYAAMPLDFIVKSGRVLVVPVFQGSFDRFKSAYDPRDRARTLREWMERRQDLGRALDYLESRPDMDSQHIGYAGASFGASTAMPLVAVEPRIKAVLMYSGGVPPPGGPLSTDLPFMDPASHAVHIRIPVLMINGRYDVVFPVETAQDPYFRLLGTPPADKRHVVLEGGHGSLPRAEMLRETLAWLDKYLGEVRH